MKNIGDSCQYYRQKRSTSFPMTVCSWQAFDLKEHFGKKKRGMCASLFKNSNSRSIKYFSGIVGMALVFVVQYYCTVQQSCVCLVTSQSSLVRAPKLPCRLKPVAFTVKFILPVLIRADLTSADSRAWRELQLTLHECLP